MYQKRPHSPDEVQMRERWKRSLDTINSYPTAHLTVAELRFVLSAPTALTVDDVPFLFDLCRLERLASRLCHSARNDATAASAAPLAERAKSNLAQFLDIKSTSLAILNSID